MIDTRSMSVTQVIAYAMWAATVFMYLTAAHVYMDGGGRLAILIAEAACILSAGAATVQLKHYAQGVCKVVSERDTLAEDVRRLQRVR